MKKILYKLIFSSLLISGLLLSFNGCVDKGTTQSLFDSVPTTPIGTTPSITSISPANVALGGVTQVTITGTNFSASNSDNLVYFKGVPADVINSSPTQLVVIPPAITGDPLKVKIAVLNSELFSNEISYKLLPAVKEFYPAESEKNFTLPYGITGDPNGNIYVSVSGLGMREITPDSVVTDFGVKGAETYWNSVAYGPGGKFYGVRGVRALFQFDATSASSVFAAISDNTLKLLCLDFDPDGNIWVGGTSGKNGNICKIKPDKSITQYNITDYITGLRVFKDGTTTYLYVAAKTDSLIKIKRMPIDSNGDLGAAETYFDFSGTYGANLNVNAIDFAADGDLYLATNVPNKPIIVVHPDKSSEGVYSKLVQPAEAISLTWASNSNYLLFTRAQVVVTDASGTAAVKTSQKVVRLDLQKQGAPYYGRQ